MNKTTMRLCALLAATLGASAFAQSPDFAAICANQVPTRAEYEADKAAYADNFCALATYEPHKAASQLNKAVSLVRGSNNPNRYYFDPRQGHTPGLYIQVLRPWMVEENRAGHDWRARHWQDAYTYDKTSALSSRIVHQFGVTDLSRHNTGWMFVSLYYRGGGYPASIVPSGSGWEGVATSWGGVTVGRCNYNIEADADMPTLTAEQVKTFVEAALDAAQHGTACPTVAGSHGEAPTMQARYGSL